VVSLAGFDLARPLVDERRHEVLITFQGIVVLVARNVNFHEMNGMEPK